MLSIKANNNILCGVMQYWYFRGFIPAVSRGGGSVTLRVYCRLWSCELAQSSLQALLSDRRIDQKHTGTGTHRRTPGKEK